MLICLLLLDLLCSQLANNYFLYSMLYFIATPAMATTPPLVRLAGFFPMQGGWSGGVSVWPSVQLALEDVNNATDLLPNTKIEVIFHDSQCNGQVGLDRLIDAHNAHREKVNSTDPPLVGIIGAGCSGVCKNQQLLANVWKYPTVSFACTSGALTDKVAYPFFMRTKAADSDMATAWIMMCKEFKWTRVATFHQAMDIFSFTINKFRTLAADNGITVISSEVVATNDDPALQVDALVKRRVPIVFYATYENKAREFFAHSFDKGIYGEGYSHVGPGWFGDGWWKRVPSDPFYVTTDKVLAVAQYSWKTASSAGEVCAPLVCKLHRPALPWQL